MSIIDFAIGLFLMNAMPHFVLGVWKRRMLSAFGFSSAANIAYGLLCFGVSLGLFLYEYGPSELLVNGMYTGAAAILVTYFLTGRFWYRLFQEKHRV